MKIVNNKVFNNWETIAKGWYIALPSKQLDRSQVKSLDICGQRVVLFRGSDDRVRALDAYCPHMGTDLGIGRVDGNNLRCFFHHWAFSGDGDCQDIPCQSVIPARAKLQAYDTDEKYGFIWIYPDTQAPDRVAEFDELKGRTVVSIADRPLERSCHHHICMMNGIDAQHLRTVHNLHIDMSLDLQSSGNAIDFTLQGELPDKTWIDRLVRKFLGDNYTYSMRYADGCLGLLTIMKNVKLLPPLHMLYAYNPVAIGKTRIQPIYITAQRSGILGWFISRFLLLCTRLAYYFLRGEDGQIYDNIRFKPHALIPIDRPIVEYMEYADRLEPSIWSQSLRTEV
jgi:phenylpropionate dioxygenase-like ring-hydroxylating dioxygenase large terminal subunit